MAYAGGSNGPVQNPNQNEGYLDERHKDYRDQARRDHLAHEFHATWWQRLRRRLRHGAPGTEG